MTFPSTNPALARALAARDYSVPTAVQLAVLEDAAAARDLLVSAQTGSGKTVAFGLAIAPALLGEAEQFERAAEPLALVIAPTRELAMQVQRELAWLYAGTGARVVTCVGGMDARAEARQLEMGAHIVVGTPGRLRDHLERRRLQLSKLRAIVLDEADEMLDLGFREDLEFILDATPDSRQTLLFSATMPREIEMLARRYQRDALRIETIRRDEPHADIEYRAIAVAPHDIENAVVNVLRLHEVRATLVFCATREAVKRMQARLLERGFSAVALSGEFTQHERTQALQALRDGRARVLVATDVAARGLDLPDLTLVIHADLPNDRETLLHRSGRTGRAGRKGLVTLIVPFNRRTRRTCCSMRPRSTPRGARRPLPTKSGRAITSAFSPMKFSQPWPSTASLPVPKPCRPRALLKRSRWRFCGCIGRGCRRLKILKKTAARRDAMARSNAMVSTAANPALAKTARVQNAQPAVNVARQIHPLNARPVPPGVKTPATWCGSASI